MLQPSNFSESVAKTTTCPITILYPVGPYVEAGSYVEMRGEDGARWRYVFDGKQCVRKEPKII